MGTGLTDGWVISLWVIVAASTLASVVAYRRRLAPPLLVTLTVAVTLRVVVVLISQGHSPGDFSIYFHQVGGLVLDGRDPLRFMPRYTWNFLPLMAYVFAAERRTGIDWQLAGKLVPVLADVATTVMVGALVTEAKAASTRLLYALSPVALLVAAHHGQVEPVAVALGLAALLLAGRRRPVSAGVVLGLAVAAKSWPLLCVPGVMRELPVRSWWRTAVASIATLGLILGSGVALLGASVRTDVHVITSYRSYLGTWGWTGIAHLAGAAGTGFSGRHVDGFAQAGTILVVVGVGALVAAFRHRSGAEITLVVLLGYLVLTPGFGGQYLLWPAALVYAVALRRGWPYLLAATGFLGFFYLVSQNSLVITQPDTAIAIQVWMSLAVIATALVAIPWRHAGGDTVPAAASDPDPGRSAGGGPVAARQGRR